MSQVDQRLVEFVKQRRAQKTAAPDPRLVDFVRQRREAKTPQVNAVGMPVLPGDADYERVQHENRAYQRELAATYDNPFEGTPGQILTRFKDAAATGFKGVVPAAYDSTIGAGLRGAVRVMNAGAEGVGLISKESADYRRAALDTYAENEARQASSTPGGSVGQFAGPVAVSTAMLLASRGRFSGTVNAAGLSIYGLSSAEQGMAEYRQTKAARGEEGSPWEELAVGAGYGAAEILFERIGINKTGAAIRSVGANMADAVLRRDANALAKIAMSTAESVGVNMTEEGATQYAQNIIDGTYDPNQDLEEGVRASSVAGGLQGLMFAGPGGAVSAAYHTGRMARGAAQTIGDVGRAVAQEVRPPAPSPAPAAQGAAPVSPVVQAAMDRLRGRRVAQSVTESHATPQPGAVPVTVTDSPLSVATESPQTGPLIPPGQQPSEQDLAEARAIIMRDPTIATQPSRFRREFMAARRARPVTEYAYTDNPDMARVLGAPQLGLTNIRTTRGDANASAQSAEGVGGQAGQVAVRGSDVPAVSTPAGVAGALPTADQGRGVAGAPDVAASPAPVGDGVGEVVRGEGAKAGNQPGDVGVSNSRVKRFAKPRSVGKVGGSRGAGYSALTKGEEEQFDEWRKTGDGAKAHTWRNDNWVYVSYPGVNETQWFSAEDWTEQDALRYLWKKENDQRTPPPTPTPKQPWEMTRGEYRETDARLVEATKARDKSRENLGGNNRWGEARRFQGAASGNRIAAADKAQARWSKAYDAADASHRAAVARALSEGKPVPAEVLADYPDLAPKPAQAPAESSAPRDTGAADYAADIPELVAVAAHANTSHVPEKRGQQRREEYAATLNAAREQLDAAAKTDEQKRIADAEFARYREGMKSRTLAYLNALSRTASSMITGPANFPVARNRKANAAADKRGQELRDFDSRARAAMLRAVNAAATPEMRAAEETGRIEQITAKFIERSRDGFNAMSKQNFVGKLERAAKNGETQAVARALQMLREEGQRRGKPLFVNRASIWKLADVATEAVQAEASAPTGEQEHAAYTDGTRVVRNYDDDRLRIFFPGKPSDAQRTTLKSRGFKWSPANGAWQRQNTQAAVYAADDILRGFGKERQDAAPTPATAPAIDATTPRTKVVAEARKKGVPAETLKKSKAEIVDAIKATENTSEPASESIEPAPADVAQRSESAAAEDRYGIRKAAADYAATTEAKHAEILKELEEARKDPESTGWETEAAKRVRQLESQLRDWSKRLGTVRDSTRVADELASALDENPPTDPVTAAKLYRTYVRAARNNLALSVWLSKVAKSAIDTAARTLLVHSGVDAGPDTTIYVWRDEYGTTNDGETYADRLRNAEKLAKDMAKEDKAARAELQRIAERGAMVNERGDVVARPEPKKATTREPTVKPFKTDAERAKGIAKAAARETSRYAINGVLVAYKGTRLVTTDGRRLWMHDRPQGFGVTDGLKSLDKDGSLKPYKAAKDDTPTFPPYDDIIPRHGPDDNLGNHDPVKLANMLRRAELMTSEEARGVLVTRNARGEIGLVAQTPEVGEAHIGARGTEALFAINPNFMAEALEWHAKNGAETVKIENAAPNKPIVITGESVNGDKTTSVTMPVSYTDRVLGREELTNEAAYRKAIDKPSAAEAKIDAIAEAAKERIAKRAKKQNSSKTLNAGLNPVQIAQAARDTLDLSIVVAAKAMNAKVFGGRSLTAIIEATAKEAGKTLDDTARRLIRRNVGRILKEAGNDPAKFEDAIKNLYDAPVTKAESKRMAAEAKAKGVKLGWKKSTRDVVRATREGYLAGVRDERRNSIAKTEMLLDRQRGLKVIDEMQRRAIRKEVVRYARTLPKKVRGALVGAIANADTPIKRKKAIRSLLRELYRHDGRSSWNWISKNAGNATLRSTKGLDADTIKIIKERRGKAAIARQALLATQNLGEMKAAAATIREQHAAIAVEITTAKAMFRQMKDMRGLNARQLADGVSQRVVAHNKAAKTDGLADPQFSLPRRLWRGFRDIRNVAQIVEGKGGDLERLLWERPERSEEAYFARSRDMTHDMQEALRRAGFKSLADAHEQISGYAGRGVTKYVTIEAGGVKHKITLGDALSLVAHNTDPATAALMATKDGQEFQTQRGRGTKGFVPTPVEVESIRKQVDPDGKYVRLIEDFKSILNKHYPEARKVVFKLTGIEPEAPEGRWPRRRNLQHSTQTQKLPERAADLVHAFAENMGVWKDRVQTTGQPIVLVDPITEMHEQIEWLAKTIELAEPVRDASMVLLDRKVREAVVSRFGLDHYNDMKSQLMAIARTDKVHTNRAAKAVSVLNSIAATKNLALNPGVWVANLTGVMRFMPYIPAKHLAAGLANMGSVSWDTIEKSGYFWDRYERAGSSRFSAVAVDGSDQVARDTMLSETRKALQNLGVLDVGASYANVRRAANATMAVLNWVESLVVRTAWAAHESQAKAEHPEWSATQRAQWVAEQTRRIIRETQNGSSPLDMALFPTESRGTAASVLTLFTSDKYKTFNRIQRAYRESASHGSKVLATELLAQSMSIAGKVALWQVLKLGVSLLAGGDDDDIDRIANETFDFDKHLSDLAANFTGIFMPFGGEEAARVINAIRKGQYMRGTSSSVPAFEPAANMIADFVNAVNTTAKNMDDEAEAKKVLVQWTRFVNSASGAFGINPFDPIARRVITEIDKTTAD